jgi:TRAP-type C4-dicarboxylate transport system permease small subunit
MEGAEMHYQPRSALGRAINTIEETLIAVILGLMTLITFANVIARYGFNSNILWALEMTSFLFAWLVLLGASYGVKVTAHLGVDAVVNMLGHGARRILGLIAAGLCIVYAFLLLKGGWDYWAPFVDLQHLQLRGTLRETAAPDPLRDSALFHGASALALHRGLSAGLAWRSRDDYHEPRGGGIGRRGRRQGRQGRLKPWTSPFSSRSSSPFC